MSLKEKLGRIYKTSNPEVVIFFPPLLWIPGILALRLFSECVIDDGTPEEKAKLDALLRESAEYLKYLDSKYCQLVRR